MEDWTADKIIALNKRLKEMMQERNITNKTTTEFFKELVEQRK